MSARPFPKSPWSPRPPPGAAFQGELTRSPGRQKAAGRVLLARKRRALCTATNLERRGLRGPVGRKHREGGRPAEPLFAGFFGEMGRLHHARCAQGMRANCWTAGLSGTICVPPTAPDLPHPIRRTQQGRDSQVAALPHSWASCWGGCPAVGRFSRHRLTALRRGLGPCPDGLAASPHSRPSGPTGRRC